MTRQQAIEELTVSLTRAIGEWEAVECSRAAWEALAFYVGDDLTRLMAKAALAVLEGQVDLHEYLCSEKLLKD